jgi:hypothetical protein
VKTNVVLEYFKAASVQNSILYRIHAADRVFKAICLRLVALGLRLRTQTPAGGVAWQIAG